MNVKVKVLFFAKAKDIAGKPNDIFSVPTPIQYSELFKIVVAKYSLTDLENNIILSVNGEYCESDSVVSLKPFDEIAVIPPLSGG